MTGMYDIHCHILPGVDDGAKSRELSLKMLSVLKEQGVTTVILTPHFRRGMFEPSMDVIYRELANLREESDSLEMKLYLGCEYHVNMDILEDIQRGRRPTLANSRFVLCEFKGVAPFSFIRERTNTLLIAGYIPVIAHAERCKALKENIDNIEELSARGCRIQINADSIVGKDGIFARRFAKKLAEYDLIDYVASDAHDLKSRAPHMREAFEKLKKWGGVHYAQYIMMEKPKEIFVGYKV